MYQFNMIPIESIPVMPTNQIFACFSTGIVNSIEMTGLSDGVLITPFRYGRDKSEIISDPSYNILLEKQNILNYTSNNYSIAPGVIVNHLSGITTVINETDVQRVIRELNINVMYPVYPVDRSIIESSETTSERVSDEGDKSWSEIVDIEDNDKKVSLDSENDQNDKSIDNDSENNIDENDVETTLSSENKRFSIPNPTQVDNYPIKHLLSIGTVKATQIRNYIHTDYMVDIFKTDEDIFDKRPTEGKIIGYAVKRSHRGEILNILYLAMMYNSKGANDRRDQIQVSVIGDESMKKAYDLIGYPSRLMRYDCINGKSTAKHLLTTRTYGNYTGELAGINYMRMDKRSKMFPLFTRINHLALFTEKHLLQSSILNVFADFMCNSMHSSKEYIKRSQLPAFKLRTKKYNRLSYLRSIKSEISINQLCFQKNLNQFENRHGQMYGALVLPDFGTRQYSSPCGKQYSESCYESDQCTVRCKAYGICAVDRRDDKESYSNNKLIGGHICLECGRIYELEELSKICAFYCIGIQHQYRNDSLTIQDRSSFGRLL